MHETQDHPHADDWGRPLAAGLRRSEHRRRQRAVLARIAAHEEPRVRDGGRLVVVESFGDLTVDWTGMPGPALRRTGDEPLPRRAVTHPHLGAARVRCPGGAVSVVLRLGPHRALVLQGRGPAGRDARVRHVAWFLGHVGADRVDLAVPDLWASPEAGETLGAAVARSARRVTVAGAAFDLTTPDGVGAWRLFAHVCVPVPSALASGTGLR